MGPKYTIHVCIGLSLIPGLFQYPYHSKKTISIQGHSHIYLKANQACHLANFSQNHIYFRRYEKSSKIFAGYIKKVKVLFKK